MNSLERYIQFTIGESVFESSSNMRFDGRFSVNGVDTGTACFVNPPEEALLAVEKPETGYREITIEAGDEDNHGICLRGDIYNYKVLTIGQDQILTMNISDSAYKWSVKSISRTWHRDVAATRVINDLISNLGVNSGRVAVDRDPQYPRGLSLTMKTKDALKQMAVETDADFFIRLGRAYMVGAGDRGLQTGVILSEDDHLLCAPTKTDIKGSIGWRILTTFDHRIGSAEQVKIESDAFDGDAKVVWGNHIFTDTGASTEMEVIPL